MNRHEEERYGRHYPTQYDGSDYNRYFLDRGRENHPLRNPDKTRGTRRSQERREDGDPARENKRKRE